MKKIATKQDCQKMISLPPIVQYAIEDVIAKLNFYYGENRNPDADMGGYVLIVENADDVSSLPDVFHLPIQEICPEFVDKIPTDQEIYTNSLVVCSSDFTITLIMPLSLTPSSFLEKCESE